MINWLNTLNHGVYDYMKVRLEELGADQRYIIWGAGSYLTQIIDKIDPKLDILCVCDTDKNRWGTEVTNRKIKCVGTEILEKYEDIVVIISIRNKRTVAEISQILNEKGIRWCHINELARMYMHEYERIQINKYNQTIGGLSEPDSKDVLRRFVSVSVPVQACQLRCEYCYIGQNGGFENDEIILPSAEFIRKSLSRKRLGGTALINFCGVGETLLCKDLEHIVSELLLEGHYISIITNALLTEEINKYVSLEHDMRKRLFFKCSFHYKQLKERNLLDLFAENVNRLRQSEISISVELVPHDELVPDILNIMEFSREHFGALPHLTVGRDEAKEDMPILTKYSLEDYRKIWNVFDSQMFCFKLGQMAKRKEYCTAGKNTFILSLESGDISPCPHEKVFFNIYDDISKKIEFKEVGCKCSDAYCRNGHAYLTLGMVKEVNAGSYLQMRDRITLDGMHWVGEDMANIFKQRICDNED